MLVGLISKLTDQREALKKMFYLPLFASSSCCHFHSNNTKMTSPQYMPLKMEKPCHVYSLWQDKSRNKSVFWFGLQTKTGHKARETWDMKSESSSFVSVSLWAVEAALLHSMMKRSYVPLPLISARCSHSPWRRRSRRLFTLVDWLCWKFGGTPDWQGINKCESHEHLTAFSVSPTTEFVRSGYLFPQQTAVYLFPPCK